MEFNGLAVQWEIHPLPVCHLPTSGMDKTVTTPLDMGAGGQQRFVVAYTLKQGTEKQPDILNAQKGATTTSTTSNNNNTISLKDSLLSSPAAIRPDGLLLSSRNNYVSFACSLGVGH